MKSDNLQHVINANHTLPLDSIYMFQNIVDVHTFFINMD